MSTRQQKDVEQLLRDEILKSGISRYRISKDIDITQARLCRFMQGGGLYAKNAQKLWQYFGYRLVKQKARAGSPKKGGRRK